MIFSAIAMMAFAGSASAQGPVKEVVIIKSSDKDYCNKKADEYINNQDDLEDGQIAGARKAFYDGCIAGRNKNVTSNTTLKS